MPDSRLQAGLDPGDVNLIAAVDRALARETRRLRVFGIADPTEGNRIPARDFLHQPS